MIKILISVLLLASACGEDLYALLGISKAASQSEIKAAYRRKARETHPDKNPDQNPEDANEQFRRIVHAFEVLSDSESRAHYDRTGRTSATSEGQRQREQQSWFSRFNFNFGYQRYVHPHLLNPYLKHQIRASQSRVIRVHSLQHLKSLLASDTDELERYFLLAFVSNSADCAHKLNNILLFPWPFAGYTSGSQSDTMFWDEILQVGLVEVDSSDLSSLRIANYFSVDVSRRCPAIVMMNRKQKISSINSCPVHYFQTSDEFHRLVWPSLKIQVTFINRSLWPLDFWWLDGNVGQRLGVLSINGEYTTDTYLSHTFIFRPTFVEGNSLTNESSLLWYTAKLSDDQSSVEILPRCFDTSGECKRWAMEGFCDTRQKSFYVQQNPDFAPYVQTHCLVSCRKKCSGDDPVQAESEAMFHAPSKYHQSDEL